MSENGEFPLLSGKIIESSSKFMCILIGWVFRNYSIWGHLGPISAHYWQKKVENNRILFKLGVYTYCGSVQKWLYYGPHMASGGRKMAQIGGFQPFSGMLIAQSISSMVCTLHSWYFKNSRVALSRLHTYLMGHTAWVCLFLIYMVQAISRIRKEDYHPEYLTCRNSKGTLELALQYSRVSP